MRPERQMRRALTLSIVGGVVIAAAAAGYIVTQSRRLYEPEVRLRTEDYADARRHFETHLIRRAGSPQRDVFSLRPPDYVAEVEYPSAGLHLKAWLTRDRVA